jgi:hypothetical protein
VAADIWTWRDGPVEPGPCVIVDLDGTLADARHRLHYLDRRPKDWPGFNGAAGKDALIVSTHRWIDATADHLSVVIITGRPTTVCDLTVDWLVRHEVRWDLLAMRPADDRAEAANLKRRLLDAVRGLGFVPLLALDDEPAVATAYERAGVPCILTASHRHSP